MRWVRPFLVFLAALPLLAPAWAQTDAPHELAPGDRVVVTVIGQAELTGDYMVDGSGAIQMPLVGAVPVADANVSELERRIAQRLANGYLQNPQVSVRLNELRPIYVLGDVKSAGAYPFRYGMTILSAIALAGGPATLQQDWVAAQGELLQAEERVDVLNAGRLVLLARAARLIAQRDGTNGIAFPPALETGSDKLRIVELTQGEREIFASQRDAERQELALLQQQAPHILAEVTAVSEQSRLERVQLELMTSQVAGLLGLQSKGLVERRRVIEVQREQARIESNVAKLTADAARARQLLDDILTKATNVRNGYQQRVLLALQDTNAKLLEVEASILAAREVVGVRRRRQDASVETRSGERSRIFITRTTRGVAETIEVDETAYLKPGDIVRIGGASSGRTASAIRPN